MTTPHFDTLYPSEIEGHIKEPLVKDLDGTPNRVLELDRDWKVQVNWSLTTRNPSTYPLDMINGTWRVQVSVESIGTGLEGIVAEADLDYDATISFTDAELAWQVELTVPAGKIDQEGVYQLVTLVTFKDPDGHRKAMAGFTEGPLISFYKDQ